MRAVEGSLGPSFKIDEDYPKRAVKNSKGPRFWEGVGERERDELTLVLAERAR
jgi:hypothetical protein